MEGNAAWVLVIIIVLLLLWTFSRRRKPRSNKLDTAIALLSDIDYDLKIIDIRTTDKLSKKNFRIDNWRFFKDRLDFLDAEQIKTINEAFALVEEFKNKIDVAKKSKALETVQDLDLGKLKEPLTLSRKGLVVWLKANVNTEMQSSTRRNWLGF
jgi:hypothetical protein